MLNNAREATIVADTDNQAGPRILFVDQAFEQMTGLTAQEVRGRPLTQVLCTDEGREHFRGLLASVAQEDSAEEYIACRSKNGGFVPCRWQVRALKNMDGQVTNYVLSITNAATTTSEFASKVYGRTGKPAPQEVGDLVRRAFSEQQLSLLSRRQRQVLALFASGGTVDDVASQLDIRPNTARNHIKAVLRKLHVGSQVQLMRSLLAAATDAPVNGDRQWPTVADSAPVSLHENAIVIS